MDNSTEELTPILVPFEKASKNGVYRDEPDNALNANYKKGKATGDWRGTEYSPDSPQNGGLTGGDNSTASTAPSDSSSDNIPKPSKKNSVLGGAALAANAAGSVVGGLGTVGNATRKLVQGMLNPGLMGQGAAGASLDAMDTIVAPDDAAKARRNNLQEAAGVFAEGKVLDDQKKAAAASAKTYEEMDQVVNGMFQQALQNNQIPGENYLHFAGGVDPNNPQGDPLKINAGQYEGFLNDFVSNLSGIMNQWITDGRDPEVIQELYKKYSTFLNSARDRYKEMRDIEKNHQDTEKAKDAAINSANAAAAVNTVATNIKYNMGNFINNPNTRWGTDFMQWALSKGLAARDEDTGELILNRGDLFIDGTGKTMDQGILDPNTTTFNFTDENMGVIKDYLDYLDHISANDPVQGPVAAEVAATLRAEKIAFDERKKKFAASGGPIKFYKNELKSTLGSTVPIKTGNLHGAQAQLVQGMQNSFNEKLIDTIGPLTGISAEQYASFANNGGIATTSLKDYDTLKQVQTQFHDYLRTNNHRAKLMAIQDKIQYARDNGLPIPALSPQELEVYANELMYQNMNTKLFAMEKMKSLDEELDSFHRQIDEYGQSAKNADGTTAYMKQSDLFDRTRDAAYEKLQDALNESNTILEESFIALADPTKRTAGQYVYNTTTKPPQLVFVPYSNTKDPGSAQTRHLFDMVTSPHAMSPTYGATSNGRVDVVYGSNNAKYGRDMQNRMTNFMTTVDEASAILGGRKNLPEGQIATASSDVSQNTSAVIDAMSTALANKFGIIGDDAISNLSSIKVPQNTAGVGPLDKNLITKYGYGVFSPSKPLTANAMQDIKGLVQNIDDIINLSATAPNGTKPISDTELRALKQYRAALVTNTANAFVKNVLNSAGASPQINPKIEQAVMKYLFPNKIPNYTPGNVIKLLETVTGEIDGGLSAEFENVTPTKAFSKNLLDMDRSNYLGSQAAPKSTTANAMISAVMSDPNNIIGLMNIIYSAI